MLGTLEARGAGIQAGREAKASGGFYGMLRRRWQALKGFPSRECGDIIGCGNTVGSVVLHLALPKDVLQLYSRNNELM